MQLRGREGMRRRLLLRAGLQADGGATAGVRPADALLLVSGSHPVRGALAWRGMLQDSVDALSIAGSLKQRGLLPAQTSLWAVANPLVDTGESLERKASMGSSFFWGTLEAMKDFCNVSIARGSVLSGSDWGCGCHRLRQEQRLFSLSRP